ncbi:MULTISPECIES: hypothetical protein [Xanthomonas translucens group]|uniref:Uncharacterized protein n=1 Tax=Xanthomonas translucens pv. translucens DSM 18974 TaxID=1261556 RepID=A0A1C3TSX5_XANCT|nr:hypothetical protein [Xanthomonas translucens]MBC3972699.1 hypothetical protein [Xanthomonas translucens pv. undulosa]MCC8448056.1 hypothetical protein [Xanthomonas translucens pv. translucens]MCT8269276.1 hypothetical protein [Xanthomonas translucens pv. undulosa]MCT8280407.1 hypothetical protein [Xanthomonas translucens pv. undulosa]MCT8315219.1 hypothetical protein [Xanthomonas translucens pv. undulosa]
MTSPIRGASSSSYHPYQTNSPESSPPPHDQSPSPAQSSGLRSLQRLNASRLTAGRAFNARFSDAHTTHDVPEYDVGRQAHISVQEDTQISQKAYSLWKRYPNGLPIDTEKEDTKKEDTKKEVKKDRKLYAAYKEIKENNGYKG